MEEKIPKCFNELTCLHQYRVKEYTTISEHVQIATIIIRKQILTTTTKRNEANISLQPYERLSLQPVW